MEKRPNGGVLLLLLAVSIPLLARLALYITSSTFFSTDVWGILRNSQVLSQYSPISLYSSVFDGYNNYWPATSFELAIFSEVTGAGLLLSVVTITSFISASIITIVYSFRRGLEGAMAATVIGAAFNVLMMTAAYTKEGYAYVLLLMMVYSLVGRANLSPVIPVVSALALPFTHHLTSLIAAVILFSSFLAHVVRLYKPLPYWAVEFRRVVVSSVPLLASQSLQYLVLGRFSTLSVVTGWLALSLVSYVVAFSLVGLAIGVFVVKVKERLLEAAALLSLVTGVALSGVVAEVVYSLDTVSLALTVLLVLTALLIVVINAVSRDRTTLSSLAWFTAIAGLIAFFVGEEIPGYESIIYRVAGFIVVLAPLTINGHRRRRAVLASALFLATSVLVYVLTFTGVAAPLGWYWVYRESEVYTGLLLKEKLTGLKVCSDVKQGMMLSGFYGVETAQIPCGSEALRLLYRYMATNGALVSAGRVVKVSVDPNRANGTVLNNGNGFLLLV